MAQRFFFIDGARADRQLQRTVWGQADRVMKLEERQAAPRAGAIKRVEPMCSLGHRVGTAPPSGCLVSCVSLS